MGRTNVWWLFAISSLGTPSQERAMMIASSHTAAGTISNGVSLDTTPPPAAMQIADTTGVPAPPMTVMHWLNQTDTVPVVRFGDGHVYVLDFTATWCGGCPAMYPPLTELARRYAAQGVRVMLVVGEGESTVDHLQQYYERDHVALPIAIAGLGSPLVFDQYGIMTLPTIVVIDQQGMVRYRWHGSTELMTNDATALNTLLKERSVQESTPKKGTQPMSLSLQKRSSRN